jgi:tetratricopeptide (TPR) repeat protein
MVTSLRTTPVSVVTVLARTIAQIVAQLCVQGALNEGFPGCLIPPLRYNNSSFRTRFFCDVRRGNRRKFAFLAPTPDSQTIMLPFAHISPRNLLNTRLAPCVLAVLLWAPFVHADDYADVNRLLSAGQTAEALARAEKFIAGKPQDLQMRFLKGVILVESGKSADAISTFVKLTEDFPGSPEPYNNLAVLYAGQSQFDKARGALETAIRTNPSYATAHENLGDVYAKLASQAYSKALQLDSSNVAVPPKLALIRNLFAPDAPGTRPTASPAAAPSSASAAGMVVSAPAKVVSAPPVAVPEKAPVVATPPTSQPEVVAAVQSWAKAWSSKNMTAYLAAYSSRFVPSQGKSRKDWEQERRARIASKGSIDVDVSDFSVRVSDTTATAVFRQDYKAGQLIANSKKTLEMTKENGRWLITKESTGG